MSLVFSKIADQYALIPFAWCQASPGTSLEYSQVILFFCQIVKYEFDFYVQEQFKNAMRKNGNNCSEFASDWKKKNIQNGQKSQNGQNWKKATFYSKNSFIIY